MTPPTHAPSTIAPATGTYALLNGAGQPTACAVPVFEGAALPVAPRGWAWRLVTQEVVGG